MVSCFVSGLSDMRIVYQEAHLSSATLCPSPEAHLAVLNLSAQCSCVFGTVGAAEKKFCMPLWPHGCTASESLVNVKAAALVNHAPWNSKALVRIVTLPRGHSSIKLPVLRGAPTELVVGICFLR